MKLRITVEGVAYEVEVEVLDNTGSTVITAPPQVAHAVTAAPAKPKPSKGPAPAAAPGDKVVKAPIAGNVVQVRVKPGDTVTLNQVLLVMEAMKMETNIASPIEGKIKAVRVTAGEAVKAGAMLIDFE